MSPEVTAGIKVCLEQVVAQHGQAGNFVVCVLNIVHGRHLQKAQDNRRFLGVDSTWGQAHDGLGIHTELSHQLRTHLTIYNILHSTNSTNLIRILELFIGQEQVCGLKVLLFLFNFQPLGVSGTVNTNTINHLLENVNLVQEFFTTIGVGLNKVVANLCLGADFINHHGNFHILGIQTQDKNCNNVKCHGGVLPVPTCIQFART